jgi:hypothetical protein
MDSILQNAAMTVLGATLAGHSSPQGALIADIAHSL